MSEVPTAAMPFRSRIDALTILRFFAATWVVSLHLQNRVHWDVPSLVNRFFVNGAYAMAVFFILSGTVMAYGYHRLQPRAADVIGFYQARFARIYIPYLVLHVIALIWFTPTPPRGVATAIYTNVLSLLGIQAWFVNSMTNSANSGTWSISAEFFFYALFPAVLPLIAWLRQRWGTLRVCAYLAALSGLIGLADYTYGNSFQYYIMPAARLPEFMLGVALGLELLSPGSARSTDNLRLLLASALALAAALNPILDHGLWIRANLLVVPAFGWFIYELARWDQRGDPGTSPLHRAFVYLGESSYCLFLAHMIPMLFLDSADGRTWVNTNFHGTAPTLWGVVYGISLLGAIALHELVEKPARRYLLARWRPAPVTASAAS